MSTLQKILLCIFVLFSFSSCRLVLGTFMSTQLNKDGAYGNPDINLEFELPDENGQLVKLSDFKNKVVYIDVWATWCGPCLGEFPHADTLQQRFAKYDDVVFVNIAVDTAITKWKNLIQKRNIKGINLIDTSEEIEELFKIDGFPTHIMVGKDGELLGHNIASPSEKTLVDFQIYKALDGMKSKKVMKKMFRSKRFIKENLDWHKKHIGHAE